MTPQHETNLRWRNASSGQDTCIDLAHTLHAIRDSKNPTGPTLHVDAAALLGAVKTELVR